MNSLNILQTTFGYSSFRLEQEQIIESVLQKKDTFVLMPTGGGKSLCYQIPALLFEGLTIVISPLIALMKDQVDSLRVNGIEAAYLNSSQSYQEQNSILNKARSNKLKLLYLAPERLVRYEENQDGTLTSRCLSPEMKLLTSANISLIAIDEAHCISQWGHDFRPEYLMLSELKKALPGVPVIALTATADKLTRKDIVEKLELKNPSVFISSFNRANIHYAVEPKRNGFERLVNFLEKRRDDAGIIYCLSRASTERVASDLCENGFSALAYHAGMDKEQRAINQEKFLKDEVKIIVATIAFGMGINKSNVRFVVHMDLPKNIEGYYQETGRAGRDGLPSDALLFFSYGDVAKLKSFARVEGNEKQSEIAFKKLDEMAAYGEISTCRRKYLLNYFDEKTDNYCGNCDVCLTTIELYDATDAARRVLSAVSCLGERYGAGYLIDFLRGSNAAKMKDEHKHLRLFGTGSHLSREEWGNVIREMIERGYLIKTKGMYPVLTHSEKCDLVMEGSEKVMLTKSKFTEEGLSIPKSEYEEELLRSLKDLRKEIAADENIPPYIVLSDASLMEIATCLPLDKNEFRKISGFGEAKIERYGKQFWEVVAEYCKERNLASRMHLKLDKPAKIRKERDSDTKRETLRLFRDGYQVERIAVLRELTVSTIETHLSYYIQEGKLQIEDVIDERDINIIRRAIEKSGTTMLSIVKQFLPEEYSYGQVKMVLADLSRRKGMRSEVEESSMIYEVAGR